MTPTTHLSDKNLHDFLSDTLSNDQRLSILDHLAQCETCSARFAEGIEHGGPQMLKKAPGGFFAETLQKINRHRREFVMYSLRVAAAACATLLLIFWGTLNVMPVMPKHTEPPKAEPNVANVLSNKLSQFSDSLLLGGLKNEKKAK